MSHGSEHLFARTVPVLRRNLPVILAVVVGGIIVFVIWNLPGLIPFFSSSTIFVVFVFLFALIIWWLGTTRGWWNGMQTGGLQQESEQKPALLTIQQEPQRRAPAKRKQPSSAAISSRPLSPARHLHARRTSALALSRRRKQQFYAGRTYRGKIHQPNLERLSVSLSGALSGPLVDQAAPQQAPDAAPEKRNGKFPTVLAVTPAPLRTVPLHETLAYQTAPMPVTRPPISILLLKEMSVEVQNERGERRSVPLRRKRREDGRYTERELLAYLAAFRGKPVARDKLLEAIFGYGLSDEKYSLTNLTNHFNKCTQFLRQDINKVAKELGIGELTIIACDRDEWRLLTDECRVVDLAEVQRLSAVLDGVSGEGFLQPDVQEACQALLDVYRGDFLEGYVEDIVRAGGDDWVDNWMREPYTAYRDIYFLASWYRAEFWRVKGYLCTGASEAERALQRNWYEMAAKLYRDYALHVLTNFTNESAMLFDLKIKQRVSQGERALRACLDMYTMTGNTQAGDAAYRTFVARMEALTQGKWKPHANTIQAWNKLKEQTKSHRFSPQVNPHELSSEEVGSSTGAHALP
jgi:hypothetical protein